MTRKEFIERVGMGAGALLLPSCLGGLAGCSSGANVPAAPTNVDFTIDISSGSLATKGNYVVQNGIVVARTLAGDFLAVSAACTHEGTTVQFISSGSYFFCSRHGATFSSTGAVTKGPAGTALRQYNTSLTGTTLRVFS